MTMTINRGRPNATTPHTMVAETQNFPVTDGYLSFTCTFRYLGSLISYNLCTTSTSL